LTCLATQLVTVQPSSDEPSRQTAVDVLCCRAIEPSSSQLVSRWTTTSSTVELARHRAFGQLSHQAVRSSKHRAVKQFSQRAFEPSSFQAFGHSTAKLSAVDQ
jgi:phosphoribosylaminoimidazole carboxylase (NCAIR synthetase)